MRSSSIQGDFEGRNGVLKIWLYGANKRLSPCSKATKRKQSLLCRMWLILPHHLILELENKVACISSQFMAHGLKPEHIYFFFLIKKKYMITKSLENNELKEVSQGIFSFAKPLLIFCGSSSSLCFFFKCDFFLYSFLHIIWIWFTSHNYFVCFIHPSPHVYSLAVSCNLFSLSFWCSVMFLIMSPIIGHLECWTVSPNTMVLISPPAHTPC